MFLGWLWHVFLDDDVTFLRWLSYVFWMVMACFGGDHGMFSGMFIA